MKKVIYSKYSNERDANFQIRTSIIQNKECKFVEKIALTNKSKVHMKNIHQNYEILCNKFYLDENIKINKCKIKNDKQLVFEYIDGKTLEETINEYILNNNYEKAINEVIKFKEIMSNTNEIIEFYKTPEFINIFGEVELPRNLKANKISNIDVIFNNIIINKNWNIVDYEWVFKFPIPVNYIIYRAIAHHNLTNIKSKFKDDIYQFIGITEKEINIYESMENKFQKYVLGKLEHTQNIYSGMKKFNYGIQNIISNKNVHELVCYIKDKEYTEDRTIKKAIDSDLINVSMDLRKFFNIEEIRIDPISSNCIIENLEIYTIKEGNRIDLPIKYTNCEIKINNKYFFNTNDPQIYVELDNFKIEDLFVNYNFIDYDNQRINKVIDEILKIKNEKELSKAKSEIELAEKEANITELEIELVEKEKYIKGLEMNLQSKKKYIADIENSKEWIAIQKIKKIIGR